MNKWKPQKLTGNFTPEYQISKEKVEKQKSYECLKFGGKLWSLLYILLPE